MSPQATRPEPGFTMIEMLVAMSIFMIALTLILPTLDVLTRSSNSTDAITAADTTLRPAMAQLANQIASAGDVTILCASNTASRLPACQTTAAGATQGFGMVVYDETSSDALNSIGTTSSGGTCYEWQVYNKHLQYMKWNSASTPPSSFTPAAPKISFTNTSGTGTSWQPPFTYDGNSVYLNFYANGGSNTTSSQLETAVAAQGGADGGSSICAPASGQTW